MSYNYNKYSSSMSSRGRGFSSRGGSSYRGRGGGGDWGGGTAGGNVSRGGYSSSRGGRFKYSTPSYDSRTKYNSGGASERYSSRGGRGDHSNSYKRPRDSYSGREDHRSSSESNRKRIRSDSYQQGGGSGGGSQRYSSSYGGSSASTPYDDNKRSSSSAVYEDKRQSDRASSYHRAEERHSASRSYVPPPPPRISDMAPPTPRYTTSSRGRIAHGNSSFRGRISTRGGRGFHRVGTRTSDVLLARKRTLTSLDYRRKLLGSRSRDYIQRVRMATTKLRRSGGTTRLAGSKKEPGTGSSMKDKDREMAKAINAEFSDDDEKDEDVESNWDEDEKPHEDEDEDVDTEKKVKEAKRKKDKQDNQNIDDEEEKEEDGKEDDEDEKAEEDEDEAEDGENEKGDRAEGSDELPSRRDGRRFIKLNCPHCAHRSVTFKEYSLHLYSGRHNTAMRRIAARHKATLARMRVVQRQEQRRVEVAARGNLPSRTMFCPICKLNYRSLKAMHHLSESHRQMKRFLTPFCRVCRIQFRSPMLFETHVCSLDHIKRKSLVEERLTTGNGEAEADSSGLEEDDKEVNLDNFMTLDSVGDVDAEEEDETAVAAAGDKKKKEKTEAAEPPAVEVEKKPKNKQMIKVGAEYIKRVEVQFCELCKVYLPRNENSERAVALHCSTRSHLKRYVRDNDDKALRRQAERIHLQTSSSSSTTTTANATANPTSATDNAKTEVSSNVEQATATSSGNNGNTGSTPAVNNTSSSSQVAETTEAPAEPEESSATVEAKKEPEVAKEAAGDEEDEDEYRGDIGDKLWDDVDKDLGDILREAEPGMKSSDDEDSRYDRFRNSEKAASQLNEGKPEGKEETKEEAAVVSPKKPEGKAKVEKTDK